MPEYHVACGFFGIYAGTLNKDKTEWVNKSLVTEEVEYSYAQYIKDKLEYSVKPKLNATFSFRDGKKLRITAELMGGNENEQNDT